MSGTSTPPGSKTKDRFTQVQRKGGKKTKKKNNIPRVRGDTWQNNPPSSECLERRRTIPLLLSSHGRGRSEVTTPQREAQRQPFSPAQESKPWDFLLAERTDRQQSAVYSQGCERSPKTESHSNGNKCESLQDRAQSVDLRTAV